ncbi:citrate synthase/methylcitrate synthase [Picrophilus oshimae]|uniref:Citrate synthase n=1 Tax=Picrophilus torridus (strain ATCC 700027 / DSM 9790 / JCM 10055 / NBRC 100828 / KAW 2/3) TaxID=1122961 RepID=Q6L2P8_PICTO|nr:citrate synthase/methylcitrate synthase [Picrophilus oshimae]AAT42754.1 2-methylcitrate-synthase [Picrophilus oshimae DSM 9789]
MDVDLGLENTYIKHTKLTYIDGELGVLRYRGYDINDVVNNLSFMETAYLMLYGRIPDPKELKLFSSYIGDGKLPERIFSMIDTFPEGDPLSMASSVFAALAIDNNMKWSIDENKRNAGRIIGLSFNVFANIYLHIKGKKLYNIDLGDPVSGFLRVTNNMDQKNVKAFEAAMILYMDHEIPASTTAALVTASTLSDMLSSLSSAMNALKGPLHGGAAENAFLEFLDIGSPENVKPWFNEHIIKNRERLIGFGHRVYKTYDPRIKKFRELSMSLCDEKNRIILDTALELERVALDYFMEKKIYPNTDFFSGLLFNELGFEHWFFTSLFALSRVTGILAHIIEYNENEQRLIRPRAIYNGDGERFIKR